MVGFHFMGAMLDGYHCEEAKVKALRVDDANANGVFARYLRIGSCEDWKKLADLLRKQELEWTWRERESRGGWRQKD